jgi:hypothetical protein
VAHQLFSVRDLILTPMDGLLIETGSLAGNVPSNPSSSNDAESGSAG